VGTSLHRRRRQLQSSVGRALLVPRVAWLGMHAPKDRLTGWNHYWSSVRSTGVGGDVLWDSGDLDEVPVYLPLMRAHLDMGLPIIDVGCGNGRFTRQLAPHFPATIGVDLSPNAVELAQRESADASISEFRALDASLPGSTAALAEQYAPLNVFVRGVFHILSPAARVEMARNLRPLVGTRGRVFLSETNYRGSALGYLESLGATFRRVPEPLQRAIRDLPQPGHFGETERAATFPAADWTLMAEGPTEIETIPLRTATEPERIPGYFAILAPRS
jgi:SAM-dependent methyltransferase